MADQIIEESKRKKDQLKEQVVSSSFSKKKILEERANLLKKQIKKEKVIGEQLEGLEFILTNEKYVLDATYVSKVIPLKGLTNLPCTPDFIKGIINVGGKIVAVVDIKKILNLPEIAISNQNRVIVLKHENIELGVLVDEIKGFCRIDLNKLQKDLSVFKGTLHDFLMGITADRTIFLDIKKFLLSDLIIVNEEI